MTILPPFQRKPSFTRFQRKPSFTRFQQTFSLEKRKQEATTILHKYPDRIPIICEKSAYEHQNSILPDLDKQKYLVPADLTIGQFMFFIRRRLKLSPDKSLFLFIGKHVAPTSAVISSLYQDHRNEDGFLYIAYSGENAFGSCHNHV